jgi:hypothetical protein
MKTTIQNTAILLAIFFLAVLLRQLEWNRNFCTFGELLAPNTTLDLAGFRFTRSATNEVNVMRISDKVSWDYEFRNTLSAKETFEGKNGSAVLLVADFRTIPYVWKTTTMCVRAP